MGPPAYQSMVSPRSRRLRTIGLLLLVAIIGMSLYGFSSLMPAIRRQAVAYHQQTVSTQPSRTESPQASRQGSRAKKIMLLQITIAYLYWGTCGLLIIALLFVAWLDLREVTRNYINQRRSVWMETAGRLQDRDSEE
ncbi:MAG TPA: hypothetical protein VFA07_15325 [Chthonomonadaceae bacterium]|nr:hypothetical protein [Chthonomonadaceae bacterium]